MENNFSEKQKLLCEIFRLLWEKSDKYQTYFLYLSNFVVNDEKLEEIEKILLEAKAEMDDFNGNLDIKLNLVYYKLQKLKTSKMEKIDYIHEIDEIAWMLKQLQTKA